MTCPPARRVARATLAHAAVAWALLATPAAAQDADRLADDERVVFFPTCARPVAADAYEVPVHGWVHEPERDSATRQGALAALAAAFDLPADDAAANALFHERAWPFLADNERGKVLALRVGDDTVVLPASEPSGHVHAALRLPPPEGGLPPGGLWIELPLLAHEPGRPPSAATALLLPPHGTSIVSDIDDTVKLSDVRDRRALLERTFLRPFEAVDGAAARYASWADAGASLHFVSGSPWQLHAPLVAFLGAEGFPRATLHLREFRLKDRSGPALLDDPGETKHAEILALLDAHPTRRFVLVGDSGESDPETYGRLLRARPAQIALAAVRDVTGEARDDARYAEAFDGVPAGRWLLFRSFDELPDLADLPDSQPP